MNWLTGKDLVNTLDGILNDRWGESKDVRDILYWPLKESMRGRILIMREACGEVNTLEEDMIELMSGGIR
jgi:hypothetical protein